MGQIRALTNKNITLFFKSWIGNTLLYIGFPLILIIILVSVTSSTEIHLRNTGDYAGDLRWHQPYTWFEKDGYFYMHDTVFVLDETDDSRIKNRIESSGLSLMSKNLFNSSKLLNNALLDYTKNNSYWKDPLVIEFLQDGSHVVSWAYNRFNWAVRPFWQFRDIMNIHYLLQSSINITLKWTDYDSINDTNLRVIFKAQASNPLYFREAILEEDPSNAQFDRLTVALLALAIGFALSLALMPAVMMLLKERKDRVLVLARLNGLSVNSYFLSHILYFYAIASIPALFTALCGLICNLHIYSAPVLTLFVLLFSGLPLASSSLLLALGLPKNKWSNIIMFFYINVVAALAVCSYVFNFVHSIFFLIPAYGPHIFLTGLIHASLADQSFSVWFINHVLGGFFVYILSPFVYYLLGIYLYQVFDYDGTGGNRSFLFPLFSLIKFYKKIFQKVDVLELPAEKEFEAEQLPDKINLDEDVLREMTKALDPTSLVNPLVVKSAVMTFRDGKTAVNNVSFTAESGIVLGLLGPNGAGKSTLINMMACLLRPTGGEIRVAGYNTRTDSVKIFQNIGYCPQQDIFWHNLTVQDHLLLFLRLKGVATTSEADRLNHLLSIVSLTGLRNQPAATLSGGEKRRLSIAMALTGNPKVLFLDEPTTGMDPEVRSNIWQIIELIKKDRLVILTTHSMEEAETLSDRITIMAQGTLKCFGTPQYLKSKFGGKLIMSISSDKEQLPIVVKAVCQMYPDRFKVLSQTLSSARFEYSGDRYDVTDIYWQIEELRKSLPISDWGFDQPSLGEVFLSIVSEAEAGA